MGGEAKLGFFGGNPFNAAALLNQGGLQQQHLSSDSMIEGGREGGRGNGGSGGGSNSNGFEWGKLEISIYTDSTPLPEEEESLPLSFPLS